MPAATSTDARTPRATTLRSGGPDRRVRRAAARPPRGAGSDAGAAISTTAVPAAPIPTVAAVAIALAVTTSPDTSIGAGLAGLAGRVCAEAQAADPRVAEPDTRVGDGGARVGDGGARVGDGGARVSDGGARVSDARSSAAHSSNRTLPADSAVALCGDVGVATA